MNVADSNDALVALVDYAPPQAPTLDSLQRLRDRLVPRFLRRTREPTVHDDRLERAALATVEDYVAVPDCDVVVDRLDAAIDGWLADDAPNARILLVVLPPCETRGLIERAARRRGFEVLEEPGRDALAEPGGVPGRAFDADAGAVLAIPRLERWFVRHRHGLGLARSLLGEIAATDRRCLVGVNSWGWRFVAKAARADLVLPPPVTLPAFDAARLRDWLVDLARADGTDGVAVRAIEGGEDVLAADEGGEPRHDFLRELAARGLGIPWVCWQLWRRGLRTLPAKDEEVGEEVGDGEAGEGGDASAGGDPRTDSRRIDDDVPARRRAADDDHTMWVTHDAPLRLPSGHEHDACLVLHALLIHAFLEPAELERTVPLVGESGIVRALERAGFVERDGSAFRCRPAAYPSVRAALDDAGYPLPPV